MRKIFILFTTLFLFSAALFAQPQKKTVEEYHLSIDSAMAEPNYEFALAQCNALLTINPADSIANVRMIPIFYFLHRIDDFIKQTEKVFPDSEKAAQMLASFSLEREGREITDSAAVWKDRNTVVTEALKLSSKNVFANVSKALLLSEEGKKGESISYMNKAIEYADAETKPGMILIKSGLYSDFLYKDSAISLLQALIKEKPDYEAAYTQLSDVYRKFNMYAEALAILEDHSNKFNKQEEDMATKYYILRDMGNKVDACNVAQEMQENKEYIWDDASQKLGCAFLLAPLNKGGISTYFYDINQNGNDYNFILEKQDSLNAGENFIFYWTIEKQGDDTTEGSSGSVTMTKAALDTAHELLNNFEDGENYQLTNRTSVWVSRAVFDEIIKNGSTVLNADGEWRTFKLVPFDKDESYYYGSIFYNDDFDKRLQLLHLMSDDDKHYEIWINKDRDYPIIIKMILDFEVVLAEVKELRIENMD